MIRGTPYPNLGFRQTGYVGVTITIKPLPSGYFEISVSQDHMMICESWMSPSSEIPDDFAGNI